MPGHDRILCRYRNSHRDLRVQNRRLSPDYDQDDMISLEVTATGFERDGKDAIDVEMQQTIVLK